MIRKGMHDLITYRSTSPERKRIPLGPYRRPTPRVRRGSEGGGPFIMGEVPLQCKAADLRRFCHFLWYLVNRGEGHELIPHSSSSSLLSSPELCDTQIYEPSIRALTRAGLLSSLELGDTQVMSCKYEPSHGQVGGKGVSVLLGRPPFPSPGWCKAADPCRSLWYLVNRGGGHDLIPRPAF